MVFINVLLPIQETKELSQQFVNHIEVVLDCGQRPMSNALYVFYVIYSSSTPRDKLVFYSYETQNIIQQGIGKHVFQSGGTDLRRKTKTW